MRPPVAHVPAGGYPVSCNKSARTARVLSNAVFGRLAFTTGISKVLLTMARFSTPLFLTMAIFLPACSSIDKFSNDTPQIVAAPDTVTAMLADAADRASNALETLAAVESARSPAAGVAPVGDAPVELRRAISVNWVGGVEPITKTLADRAGYRFLIVGNAPPAPVIVSLNVENRPVIEILRDIGLQIGMRGDIKVDSSQRLVEIHYPPNTGVGS